MKEKVGQWIVGALVVICIIYAVANKDDHEPAQRTPSAPSDSDSESTSTSDLRFHGYDCTVDCSGHEAGYQWAEEHDIDDEDNCGGNSDSFIEGCKAYVHEQEMGTTDDDSSDPDTDDG